MSTPVFDELGGVSTGLGAALRPKANAFAKGLLNDGKGNLGADSAPAGGAADFSGASSDFASDAGVADVVDVPEVGVAGVVVDVVYAGLGTACLRVFWASSSPSLGRESSVVCGVEEGFVDAFAVSLVVCET